jgi:hypothetical protein
VQKCSRSRMYWIPSDCACVDFHRMAENAVKIISLEVRRLRARTVVAQVDIRAPWTWILGFGTNMPSVEDRLARARCEAVPAILYPCTRHGWSVGRREVCKAVNTYSTGWRRSRAWIRYRCRTVPTWFRILDEGSGLTPRMRRLPERRLRRWQALSCTTFFTRLDEVSGVFRST